MAFDSTKSMDVGADGVSFEEDKHHVTAGDDSPVGNAAPLWSRYYRTNGEVWAKTGAGDNDWEILRSGLVSQSASPGYNFGRSGNNSAGTFLQRAGGVVSNRVGIPISVTGVLDSVITDNENSTSYTIVVFEHDGSEANRTDLATLVVSGSTGDNVTGLAQPVTFGKQLGVEITAGNARNIGVTCILKGS